ncbi:OLC1v1028544C1 [Oldenlandia corymbosa var. corymbosa]|uniref:OLC1v1028544C1 n=1 Tax=Oldenlandia corymbosa var. corymbosa TaxID=529605 RepID=A0AAV1CBY4_OLDCO|nr:OLC1v1028544C1 [Oldenlandia corymbosa var. corymbosa]
MGTTHSTHTTTSSSIESSFQNLSLNCGTGDIITGGGGGNYQSIITSESVGSNFGNHESSPNQSLELNSHIRMPYPWEQCLDVQTGEVYYINWKTGVKTKEDPRKMSFFRREESEEESSELDLDDVLSLDSLEIDQAMQQQLEEEEEGDSSVSSTTTINTVVEEFAASAAAGVSPAGCRPTYLHPFWEGGEVELENPGSSIINPYNNNNIDDCINQRSQEVLVLAGCKWCYLYFMVPKQVEECPKCSGQLLRFDPLDGHSIN